MWSDIDFLVTDDTWTLELPVGLGQGCGTALYQVNTLLQVTSSEEVSVNPQLQGCSSRDGCIVLVIDRSVALLDSTRLSVLLQIYFDTPVDVVGLCQEKQFLVVGERSGNFHLIHIPTQQILLTQILTENSSSEKAYLKLFIIKDNADAGLYHMFVLTSSGCFCVLCLPLAQAQEGRIGISWEQGGLQIKTVFIATEEQHNLGCQEFVISSSVDKIQLIIGGKGDYVLSRWEVDTTNALVSLQNVADSSLIEGAAKLRVLDNLLFVLDTENILSVWDVYSLTLIWDWPSLQVEEFLLTTESDSIQVIREGLANVKLIILTTPDNKQMRNLMVLSPPAMQLLYSLKVSVVSSLVQSEICTDTIYFLEGTHEKHQMPSEDPVSMVVMRGLSEALPENRLRRLLYKQMFTVAERFALQFGLDVELVYQMKANAILEKLASASVGSYGQEVCLDLVREAKENLQKIQDSQFVVNYCINAPWPLYEIAEEMLSYAKVRVRGFIAEIDFKSLVCTQVLRVQARLTTFYGAFGPEKFSASAWPEFLINEDMFRNVISQLKEGNFSCAQYLWLRHQADFENSFDEKMLNDLLSAIPLTVPFNELCLWLKNTVIPFSRRAVPDGQKILAKWLEQCVRNLELTDKANWPENGLQMAEIFFTSTNQGEGGLTTFEQLTPLRCGDSEEILGLKKLVHELQELIKLYRKYNCRLALSDFEKENATTIVFRMFDKILAPELVPSILEKFIKPYMCEHNLEKDELLLQYIKNLLEPCQTRYFSVFETAWEAKAVAVIGCISDIYLKLDAILQLVDGARVPWSAAVEQLVKQHLEMDNDKVDLLQDSYKLMEVKKLLQAYGIRETNVLSDEEMRMMFVRYIFKQNTPTALEDALKVAEAFSLSTGEVYFLRIIHLNDKEREEQCLPFLKSLSLAEAEHVAERLTLMGKLVLRNKPEDAEQQNEQMSMTKMVVEVLKFLLSIQKDDSVKKNEREANLKVFETIATLQEHFGIFISDEEFINPSLRSDLLEHHINTYENARDASKSKKVEPVNSEGDKAKKPLTESRLYRLAQLLQVSEHQLGEKLAVRALAAGEVEAALKICREFYENHPNEGTGKLLFSVAQRLCSMLGAEIPMAIHNDMNLPVVIHELASQAATVCSPDLLLDCAELCQYTSIAQDIYRQCQIDSEGFTTKTLSFGEDKDFYEDWTYDDLFKEDGIAPDAQTTMPATYEFISSVLPVFERYAEHEHPKYSPELFLPSLPGQKHPLAVEAPVRATVQNLLDCSQCQLALHLTICAFGSCYPHSIVDTTDLALSEKLCSVSTFAETQSFLAAMGEKCNSVIKITTLTLLHKVFNSRVIDHKMALAYCTLLPSIEVFQTLWNVIRSTHQNYRKALAVGLVGVQLAERYGKEEEKKKFQDLVTDAEWGIQLWQFGISFETVFRQPPVKKKELIKMLVENTDVDTGLIFKYCSAFLLDRDEVLELCIETLLLQNTKERKKKQTHSTLLARALEITPLLKSTRKLVTNLTGILYKLNPYDYETIEIVLRMIQNVDENPSIQLNQALSLLKHLESYKRISPPVDTERQFVLAQMTLLPPAAHTRLPFHLIFFRTSQYFWDIMSQELSEESYQTLLLIAKLMKISQDTFHMCAAQYVFEKKLKPKISELKSTACPSVVNKETIQDVYTIQTYLLSIDNPEYAVAVALKIAKEFPVGPDHVQALNFCLFLADRWQKNNKVEEESHRKAEFLYNKLEMQYKRAATENVLIEHNLNTGEFLKYLEKPAHLIFSLYEHPSVAQRIQNPTGRDHPDIHAVAEEIADINDLSMIKIRNILLEKWLCPSTPPSEKTQDIFGNVQEDEDLRRVIYLLQSFPMDDNSKLLFAMTTSHTSPIGGTQLTFAHRSRALKCLLHLADAKTVESLFEKPIETVKYYLRCCIYLAEFEILNIPYTYQSFHKSSKEGLIKGLWKNHSNEPTAVRLMTELSLDYKVYDPQLWNSLLYKILSFNMIQYLRRVLKAIAGIHSLWQIPSFSRAWQSVVLSPLLTASHPPSPKELEECCECFVILLKCPVLANLDIAGIAKQYTQLGLPVFTLGCLLLIPQSEKREQQIQSFLLTCDTETVLQQIDEHMGTGEIVAFASKIRSLVLDSIINQQLYKKFLKTKYYPLLKQHLINTHQIEELVEYFAKSN
ncbi:KNTC1 protein, partial [Smithornis capensis]|nr:KNTC1 protein [Smithornis capensis]